MPAAAAARSPARSTNAATLVSNGLFTVTLDFGAGAFTGTNLWLQIGVRTNSSTDGFTGLVPRQPVLPAPYAIMASSASNLLGKLPAEQLSGTLPASQVSGTIPLAQLPASVLTNGASGIVLSGSFTGDGAGLTNLSPNFSGYSNVFSLSPFYMWNSNVIYVAGTGDPILDGQYTPAGPQWFVNGLGSGLVYDNGFSCVGAWGFTNAHGSDLCGDGVLWDYVLTNIDTTTGNPALEPVIGAGYVQGEGLWDMDGSLTYGTNGMIPAVSFLGPVGISNDVTVSGKQVVEGTQMVMSNQTVLGSVTASNFSGYVDPTNTLVVSPTHNGLLSKDDYWAIKPKPSFPLPPMYITPWATHYWSTTETDVWGYVQMVKTNGMDAYGWKYIHLDDLGAVFGCGTNFCYSNGVPCSALFPSGFASLFNMIHTNGLKVGWYLKPNCHDWNSITWLLTNGVDLVHLDFDYTYPYAFSKTAVELLSSNTLTPPFIWSSATVTPQDTLAHPDIFALVNGWTLFFGSDPTMDIANLWWVVGAHVRAWPYVQPGHFPSALGVWSVTNYHTAFGLSCMLSAMLRVANFDSLDSTYSAKGLPVCCTNRELIAIDQDPLVMPCREVRDANGIQVLEKLLVDGSKAVALFNHATNGAAGSATIAFSDVSMPSVCYVRDVFWNRSLGCFTNNFTTAMPISELRIFRFIPASPVLPGS